MTVAHRIVPAWNSVAFFEVTATSFHHVSEVLAAAGRDRYSVSGWFYSAAPVVRPPPYLEPPPERVPYATAADRDSNNEDKEEEEGALLAAWVRPEYLQTDAQARLRAAFLEASSVQLVQFLRAERYDAVVTALASLNSDDGAWVRAQRARRTLSARS
jgi:prolyl 3-hydroxylase /prolyl 3,4-dihydroxylase